MKLTEASYDLERFERFDVDPASFRHVDHLEAAFAMLTKYSFIEACARYSQTIKTMAESVGALDKFNTTITIAFMSIVAERRDRTGSKDWPSFVASNSDLLDKAILENWYSKDRLNSDLARTQFLLPDKVG